MSTQIEQQLRDALAARAAELPTDATARLLAAKYRPRDSIPRPAVAAAGATVAAGAVLATSLIGLGTQTPRALAGWSATPTAPIGDQTQTASEACRSRLPTSKGIERAQETAAGPHRAWPTPPIPAGGWSAVLTDTRGPYTAILFEAAGGRAEMSCFSGRQPAQAVLGGSWGTQTPSPVPAGEITLVSSGGHVTPPDEGSEQFSQLVGRTGPGVTDVTLRLDDGTRVTASSANGWFMAWWPGRHSVITSEVRTSSGSVVRAFGGQLSPRVRRARTAAGTARPRSG
jgi:hypothetical protein